MGKVILVCGKICSGKSFYSKQLKESLNAVIITPDKPHAATHINYDEEKGTFTVTTHEEGGKTTSQTGNYYLTTACMKHYMDEFDDNCYYLDILRWFRDTFVSKEDKKEYYEVAPKVVETLDSLENANEVYNQIYTKVIQVCVRLIEYGRYDEAYQIYKDNVLDLQNRFVRKLVPSQE